MSIRKKGGCSGNLDKHTAHGSYNKGLKTNFLTTFQNNSQER